MANTVKTPPEPHAEPFSKRRRHPCVMGNE